MYQEVIPKYDLYHLVADHGIFSHNRVKTNVKSFGEVIGYQNVSVVTINSISEKIIEIITEAARQESFTVDISNEPSNKKEKKKKKGLPLISW